MSIIATLRQRFLIASLVLAGSVSAIGLYGSQQELVAQPIQAVPIQALPPENPTVWRPAQGSWRPVASHREDYGKIKLVWLAGTPYEMGYQHGTLLHAEIASMGREVINTLNFLGRGMALGRLTLWGDHPRSGGGDFARSHPPLYATVYTDLA